eukprot:3839922-Pleurochrysis_carterae.AAC.1
MRVSSLPCRCVVLSCPLFFPADSFLPDFPSPPHPIAAGVAELFRPDFRALFDLEIWAAAVSQLFFGVSVGLGTLTTYASYNPRHHPVVAAAVTVSLANSAFSLLSGITVFAFLGYLSELQGVPVPQLVASGPALAFEVFPVAIGLMPLPNLWAILFFVSPRRAAIAS